MTYILNAHLKILDTENQFIIMDVKQGKFYRCNRTGAMVINLLRSGDAMDVIAKKLEGRFEASPGTASTDVLRFIQLLIKNKLCRVGD